jgi:sarcinarray family protein
MFFSICCPLCSALNCAYEAPECLYGTFDAWFSSDGVNWVNTTLEDITLRRGEIFYVKTMMSTTKPVVQVGMMFSEPGEFSANSSTFEIINGTTSMFCPYIYGIIEQPSASFEHIWTFQVKKDTTWVQATAPLNVFVQFDCNEQNTWVTDQISFTVVYPTISDELYVDGIDNEQDDRMHFSRESPDIPFICVIVFFILIAMKGKQMR